MLILRDLCDSVMKDPSTKFAMARTPSPARETRALPGISDVVADGTGQECAFLFVHKKRGSNVTDIVIDLSAAVF